MAGDWVRRDIGEAPTERGKREGKVGRREGRGRVRKQKDRIRVR